MLSLLAITATLVVGPTAVPDNCWPFVGAYACYKNQNGHEIFMRHYKDFLPPGEYTIECPAMKYPSFLNTDHYAWRKAGIAVTKHNGLPVHINGGMILAHECAHVYGRRH